MNNNNKIQASSIIKECWNCECLQKIVEQLIYHTGDIPVSDLSELIKQAQQSNFCIGFDPCPAGMLFLKYLKDRA